MTITNRKRSIRSDKGKRRKLWFMRRVNLASYRIPAWLELWIKKQPGSGGKIIERSVIDANGLEEIERQYNKGMHHEKDI